MFYKPKKERQWDSWIFKEKGVYYMFYINVSDGGSRWDGISVATSSDLVHWTEYGRVLTKDADAIWLGTGMVYKVGSEYYMNYSLEKPANYQRVYFAKSSDLLHWEKIEGACSAPDGVIYMSEPSETCDNMPRWDSLGVFEPLEDKKPPYYAFCSSNVKNAKLVEKSGVLGLVTSDDGLNWKCLPPAFSNPDVFPSCEVPEYFTLNGRHYAIFCTSSYLGYRCDDRAEYASGGTYYVVSDNKTTGYHLPEGDPMLQGTRDNNMVCMNYVGRVFKDNGKLNYYHIWGEPASDAWMGMIKEVVEEKPYKLALRYNKLNDILKGNTLLINPQLNDFAEVKRVGVIPAVNWNQVGDGISFTNNGSSGAIATTLNGSEKTQSFTDLADGRVIEANVTIEGCGAGIYFDTVNGQRATIFLNKKRQRVECAFMQNGWGGNMVLYKDVYKSFEINKDSQLKVFARRMFLEVYIDEKYVCGWRIVDEIKPNNFGLYAEDSDGIFSDLKVFQMK